MKRISGTIYVECDLCYDHTCNYISCYRCGHTVCNVCFYMKENCKCVVCGSNFVESFLEGIKKEIKNNGEIILRKRFTETSTQTY